jgi:hypothetical protein
VEIFQITGLQWAIALGVTAFLWWAVQNWIYSKFVKKTDFEIHEEKQRKDLNTHKESVSAQLNNIILSANTHKEQSIKDNADLKLQMASMKGQMDLVGSNLTHLLDNVKDIKINAAKTEETVIKSISHMEANQKVVLDFVANVLKQHEEKK